MASGFGAGLGADMLQEILQRKFREAATMRELANREAMLSEQGRQANMRNTNDVRRMDQDDAQFNFTKQRTGVEDQRYESAAPERATKIRYMDAQANALEAPPKPKMHAVTVPGPNGQPMHKLVTEEEMQQGVQGYRAPSAPSQTHARYSISDGTDANGKPVKIRMNVDTGQIESVALPDGVSAPKREQPATQDQTNAAMYAKRIEQADPILKKLEGGIAGMNIVSFETQTRADHPKLQSPEIQSYQQAARNFITAVLRKESGAVISPQEFAEAKKQYLPVPGDAPETRQQKAENRRIVYEQLKQGAGAAYRGTAQGGGSDAAAKAAELLKKYGGG